MRHSAFSTYSDLKVLPKKKVTTVKGKIIQDKVWEALNSNLTTTVSLLILSLSGITWLTVLWYVAFWLVWVLFPKKLIISQKIPPAEARIKHVK